MSNREIAIRIVANVKGLTAGLATASRQVSNFESELERSAKKRDAINKIGTAYLAVGAAAAVGVAAAVRSAANFDEAMSHVLATGTDAVANQEALRKAAIKAGAATQYSATEAAGGIEQLAKAGVSAKDILGGGLTGALNLAAASGEGVADSAETIATTLNQFGLSGSNATHVADLLSAAANKAQGNVSDMASALEYVGPVSHQMGVSLEETTGTIAELAGQGILGSQAGTSLRGMLTAMTSPSKLASSTMKSLGINVYDARGKFVGFAGVAQQLHDKLGKLSNKARDAALGNMFGNEQITAARILYSGGAAAVDKWTTAVNDSGNASRTAAKRMDNLKGDFEQFKGSLETALIGTGEGAQTPLRGLVQDLTKIVNAYNKLSPAAQSTAFKMLAGVAAFGLVSGGALKATTSFASLQSTLRGLGATEDATSTKMLALKGAAGFAGAAVFALGASTQKSNDALGSLEEIGGGALMGFAAGGPIGLAIGAGVGSMAALWGATNKAKDAQKELAAEAANVAGALDQETGAATNASRAWAIKGMTKSGTLKTGRGIGLTNAQMADASNGDDTAMAQVEAKLKAARDSAKSDKMSDYYGKLADGENAVTAGNESDYAYRQRLKALDKLSAAIGVNAKAVGKQRQQIHQVNETAYEEAKGWGAVAKSLATAAGSTDKYVGALTTVPKSVRTDVTQHGANASMSSIKQLATAYGHSPKWVETTLLARDMASGKVKVVGGKVRGLDGKSATAKLYAKDLASGKIKLIDGKLYRLDGTTAVPLIGASAGTAYQVVRDVNGKLHALDMTHVSSAISADGSSAYATINGVRYALSSLPKSTRRTIEIDKITKNTEIFNKIITYTTGTPTKGQTGYGVVKSNADGNIIKFADGGTYDARGLTARVLTGTTRIGGEAGPEAYIPLSAGKRQRSLALWAETGRMLGAQAFANGGIRGGAAAGSGGSGVDVRIKSAKFTLTDESHGVLTDIITETIADQSTWAAQQKKAGRR